VSTIYIVAQKHLNLSCYRRVLRISLIKLQKIAIFGVFNIFCDLFYWLMLLPNPMAFETESIDTTIVCQVRQKLLSPHLSMTLRVFIEN